MGEHSKAGTGWLAALKGRKRLVLAVVVAVVGVWSAVDPSFPADSVLGVVHAVLGL
ncbi:hypothetical protein ACIQ7S_03570 [Streptomyces griseoluteus]|uniref:hypothetical protein n=1 Tax=Streptomyces TaxID=1883 RepID=UPI003318BE59